MPALLDILNNSTTVQVVLKNIDPEDISLPNIRITNTEMEYLINNRVSLGECQIDPVIKQVLTIYHGTQDVEVKGKLLCILKNLAA